MILLAIGALLLTPMSLIVLAGAVKYQKQSSLTLVDKIVLWSAFAGLLFLTASVFELIVRSW